MQEKYDIKRNCPFCGKEIIYQHVEEDGTDWEGHKRGSARSWDTDKECECEKHKFKKMCLNCAYNDAETCECEAVIAELKNKISTESPFVISDICADIKDVTKKCAHWKLSTELFEQYFE